VVAPEHEVKPRNTLFVLLVLAALGAYVYWVELPEEARKTEEERLLAFEPEKVRGITLAYPERTIVLEKADGTWRITEPLQDDADAAVVDNLVRAVADAKITRTLEDVSDKLASYGLEKPVATVTLRLEDGTALPAIKVGETTSVGFSSYAQRGDDPKVLITAAAFQSGMKKELKDLRDKRLVAFEDADVKRIELARAGVAPVVLERGEGETWTITAPGSHPADAAEVRALLASARGIRAMDFVSDDAAADLGAFGLAEPRLALRLRVGEKDAEQSVLIGAAHEDEKKKALYAKRGDRPTVYTIAEYALKNLDKDAATLRDKTVMRYEAARAASIVVVRKDGLGFTLEKQGDAWHVKDGDPTTERGPTISRFVDDLHGFKGSEIAAEGQFDLAAYGLDEPDLSITVLDAEGGTIGTVLAVRGQAAPDAEAASSHAMAANGTVVYGMKPFVYDRIDKKPDDFRQQPAPSPAPASAPTAAPPAG
jgi:hypothetical protein